MKQFLSTLLWSLARGLLKGYRRATLDLLQIEATVWYVRGVGAVRQLLMGGLALLGLIALAAVGFLLVHIGLYALLPTPINAMVLLALGAFYLIVALLGLRWAFAEKTWMRYSQATRMVERATGKVPSAKP